MKRVQFKDDLVEAVYAHMFEEHLIMELNWFREYFINFLNLTIQDVILECCDNEMICIYDTDTLPITHSGKKEYVHHLMDYLKSKDLFCKSYMSQRMKDLFQIFTDAEFENFKKLNTIINEDLPILFTLYYCIHIHFWCLRTCSLLHYRQTDKYNYLLYRNQCLEFYEEIVQNTVPNIAKEDTLTWIDFIDSFFVTNFGSKCSLLGGI